MCGPAEVDEVLLPKLMARAHFGSPVLALDARAFEL
jgi:hypothetical protein